MPDVYVAAGSNVEPEDNLAAHCRHWNGAYGPLRVSPAYRNKAVGFEGADFINLVVGFGTDAAGRGGARAVCRRSKPPATGRRMRRSGRRARWISTSCCMATLVSDEPGLIVPRPDLLRRAYMLKPMADIAPDWSIRPCTRQCASCGTRSTARDHDGSNVVTIPRSDRHRPPGSAP